MNARELKRLLRKQTRCSYWRMIVPDKYYDTVRGGMMRTLVDLYKEDQERHRDENWDCDDIARDFWCYAKRVIKGPRNENGIVGRVIFPDHAEIIYVKTRVLPTALDHVYYIDQRDWNIRKPYKKPKWIEL